MCTLRFLVFLFFSSSSQQEVDLNTARVLTRWMAPCQMPKTFAWRQSFSFPLFFCCCCVVFRYRRNSFSMFSSREFLLVPILDANASPIIPIYIDAGNVGFRLDDGSLHQFDQHKDASAFSSFELIEFLRQRKAFIFLII